MHAPKQWVGMIVLLLLASMLAGCITINPGASRLARAATSVAAISAAT